MKVHARATIEQLHRIDDVATYSVRYDQTAQDLLDRYGSSFSEFCTLLVLEVIESCDEDRLAERSLRLCAEVWILLQRLRQQPDHSPITLLWRLLSCLVRSDSVPVWRPFLLYTCQRSTQAVVDLRELGYAVRRNGALCAVLYRCLLDVDAGATSTLATLERALGVAGADAVVQALAQQPTDRPVEQDDGLPLAELLDYANLPSTLAVARATGREWGDAVEGDALHAALSAVMNPPKEQWSADLEPGGMSRTMSACDEPPPLMRRESSQPRLAIAAG